MSNDSIDNKNLEYVPPGLIRTVCPIDTGEIHRRPFLEKLAAKEAELAQMQRKILEVLRSDETDAQKVAWLRGFSVDWPGAGGESP